MGVFSVATPPGKGGMTRDGMVTLAPPHLPASRMAVLTSAPDALSTHRATRGAVTRLTVSAQQITLLRALSTLNLLATSPVRREAAST
jgi:hypothetical protein